MRKYIEYLLHHTLWKNEKVAFFSFVILPIVIFFMFLDMKLYIPLKVVLYTFCLIVFAIIIYQRKNFYNKFYRTKYINSSKDSYLMYSIEEKKKFYETVIQVVKIKDFKRFKGVVSLEEFECFVDKITENLNVDFFISKIKQANSNIWIRDYFNFKNITIDSLSYIQPLIDKGQVFNYKELATLLYTNIVFNKNEIILNDNFNKDLHQLLSKKEIKNTETIDLKNYQLFKLSILEIDLIKFLKNHFYTQKEYDINEILICIIRGNINDLEKGSLYAYENKIDCSRIFFQLYENKCFNEVILNNIYKREIVKINEDTYLNSTDFNRHNSRFYNNVEDKTPLINNKINLNKLFK